MMWMNVCYDVGRDVPVHRECRYPVRLRSLFTATATKRREAEKLGEGEVKGRERGRRPDASYTLQKTKQKIRRAETKSL